MIFNLLESFFILSLAIMFVLVGILLYHFRGRLDASEKQFDNLSNVCIGLGEEIKALRVYMNSMQMQQMQQHHRPHKPFLQPASASAAPPPPAHAPAPAPAPAPAAPYRICVSDDEDDGEDADDEDEEDGDDENESSAPLVENVGLTTKEIHVRKVDRSGPSREDAMASVPPPPPAAISLPNVMSMQELIRNMTTDFMLSASGGGGGCMDDDLSAMGISLDVMGMGVGMGIGVDIDIFGGGGACAGQQPPIGFSILGLGMGTTPPTPQPPPPHNNNVVELIDDKDIISSPQPHNELTNLTDDIDEDISIDLEPDEYEDDHFENDEEDHAPITTSISSQVQPENENVKQEEEEERQQQQRVGGRRDGMSKYHKMNVSTLRDLVTERNAAPPEMATDELHKLKKNELIALLAAAAAAAAPSVISIDVDVPPSAAPEDNQP